MAKYKVKLGAFVTKLKERQFEVSAPNAEEAALKATDKFRAICLKNLEDVDTIVVDSVEKQDD